MIALLSALHPQIGNAEWLSRTVMNVGGDFADMTPAFGYESYSKSSGIAAVDWGDPFVGSFTSRLRFDGYDSPYPYPVGGITISPRQTFSAGTIEFRNGTLNGSSSASDVHVDLHVQVFGSEFDRDNHPLLIQDTWGIEIRQTTNQGVSEEADADYFYFTDFPWLGSFRVNEGDTARVEIIAKFGSIEPALFGDVDDPSKGFVVPSIVADPNAPGVAAVPEPSSIILILCALGTLGMKASIQRRKSAPPCH